MLRDEEFLEKMWERIDEEEYMEAERIRVAERSKKIRNKTIRDYIYILIVSISLVLLARYSPSEVTEVMSLVVIGLVYLYENRNSRVIGVGEI